MIQTAEQLIENVRALPNAERRKLFELIEVEKNRDNEQTDDLPEKNEKFQLALQWIEEHKEEFDGQWICLDGDKLIAHGFDGKKVYEEAKARGIETPFMERVKAKTLPFGGW